MTERRPPSWPLVLLGAVCIAAIVIAVLLVGPAPATQTSVSRTATVGQGVVQSTVSGSGNLEPVSELDLGFKTSGTVTDVYVHQGEQVVKGQLLATLDPSSAEVTLEQARANLQSAEANLTAEEEDDGEGSSGGSGSGGASASASTASVRATTAATESTTATSTTTPAAGSTTTPAAVGPTTSRTSGSAGSGTAPAPSSKSSSSRTTTSGASHSTGSSSSGSTPTSTSSGAGTKATLSTAAREANIASARAAVRTDRLSVHSDEQALQATKLYAPEDGTIASLSGQVGEVVSGGGTTRANTSSSASSSSSSSAASGLGATGSTGAGSSGSGSAGSSSSSFAVLSDLSTMKLVVALSESEVGSVHPGQIATVTVEALEGRKLAAHVAEVAILSTSSSGAVSYDVTFDLDQLDEGVKPGMSATAEVVVKQASGLNVPTTAISGGSVTVVSGSHRETVRVTTGLAGDTSTIVLSGLKAGETVALPSVTTTKSTLGTGSGRTTRGLSGLGGGGGFAIPGGGAGGGAFLRGGG